MTSHSNWIWLAQGASVDQYAEFYDSFDFDGKALLRISADSNYAVYLNGHLACSGQYPDFPSYKIYDELDLRPLCRTGKNHLAIVVWYYGKSNMGYYPGKAALRYEILAGNQVLCASSCSTLSRQSPCYQCGLQKIITHQLGFSFRYDMTHEDGWMLGDLNNFTPSAAVPQDLPLSLRPVPRPEIHAPVPSKLIKTHDSTHALFDLGQEEVGFLTLCIDSTQEQDVLIAYGEHICDGGVRRIIGNRDFSVELHLRKSRNTYVNPFRRLGLRYLELFAHAPVQVHQLTVLPVLYPLTYAADLPLMTAQQQQIYDVCLRTLHLCMHEHYEDTPWREQALYAMDGRNQILCGYYAFREFAFPRANLLLMSKDHRADGLLSICTPSQDDLTIPSFSLHYFTEILEYTQHSGDLTLAREIWPKLTSLINVFINKLENNLLPVFCEECHWNFYEWSHGMHGSKVHCWDDKRFDAALNCLFSLALQATQQLADMLSLPADYASLAQRVNFAIQRCFYDPGRGMYTNSTEDPCGSVLVNALAILCGAAQNHRVMIAEKLSQPDHNLTPISLSMSCFLYDALLAVDRARYTDFVLADITRKYQRMLDAGATTFWETEKGESAFSNAGSLCHGWSAMPVYYYHTLLPRAPQQPHPAS